MRIQLSDGRTVELPDGMSQQEMEAALRAIPPKKADPVEFDAMTAIENIPGSAKQLGEDIWSAVSDPVETVKGVAALGGSALAKGQRKVRELAAGVEIEPGEDEQVADAVWDAAVERYGSVDALKKTMMYDPVGFATDFAGGLGAAGKLGKSSKLAKLGESLDPVNAGSILTRKAVQHGVPDGAARKMSESLYESALKLGTKQKNRGRIIRTGIDERIKPTKRGVKKMEGKLSQAEANLDNIIAEAGAEGRRIPVEKLYQHVDQLFDDVGGLKAEGLRDQGRVMNVVSEVMENMGERKYLTAKEAQEFKVDLYDKIYARKISPEPKKRTGVKTEAQSAVARGAREAIEEAVPEAADINKILGDLYTARAPISQSAARIANTNKIPARALFGGAAGGWKGALAAWITDSPRLKTNLAFAIDKARKGDIGAVEKTLKNTQHIRLALALAERSNEELEELGLLE